MIKCCCKSPAKRRIKKKKVNEENKNRAKCCRGRYSGCALLPGWQKMEKKRKKGRERDKEDKKEVDGRTDGRTREQMKWKLFLSARVSDVGRDIVS